MNGNTKSDILEINGAYMTYFTKSAQETEAVGAELARIIDESGAKRVFIAMRGEMGVGKTAFTRGLASYFDITGVKSPTYTIVNEYKGKRRIFHYDMYRVASEDDLYSTGYDDYLERDGITVAEWSENIEEFIPDNAIFVTISRTPDLDEGRRIEVDYDNFGI